MTREEAIRRIKIMKELDEKELANIPNHEPLSLDIEALKMAIQALEQEPTVTSTDEPMTMVYPTIFCDDAVSRQAVIDALYDKAPDQEGVDDVIAIIKELPPVQPIHGKMLICPSCGLDVHSDLFKKCPRCGAEVDMKGDAE